MSRTKEQWIKQLEQEGFTDLDVCPLGAPHTLFDEHTHEEETVHVILEGELTLTEKNHTVVMKKGEKFVIPAGTTHTAQCGPQGCTFLVGTKHA